MLWKKKQKRTYNQYSRTLWWVPVIFPQPVNAERIKWPEKRAERKRKNSGMWIRSMPPRLLKKRHLAKYLLRLHSIRNSLVILPEGPEG